MTVTSRPTAVGHEITFRTVEKLADDSYRLLLDWRCDGEVRAVVTVSVPAEAFVELAIPFERRARFWQAVAKLSAQRVRQAVEHGVEPPGPPAAPFPVSPNLAWAVAMACDSGPLTLCNPGEVMLAFTGLA